MRSAREKRLDIGYGQEVVESVLNRTSLVEALSSMGEMTFPGSAADCARVLAHRYSVAKGLELAECDRCFGKSDEKLDACPFCGDKDESAAATEVASKARKEGDMIGGVTADELERIKNGASTSKGATAMVVKATKASQLAKPSPKTGPAVVENREEVLNTAVEKIRKLQAAGAMCTWQLGQELRMIFESELWMARQKDLTGAKRGQRGVKYKAFDQFTRVELGMAAKNAMSLMKFTKEFTELQVKELGPAKLALLLQAPIEKRKSLTKKAKKKTARQLKEEVKRANAEAGRGRNRSKITVISVEPTAVVHLFCKPASGEKRPKRATTLSDLPWGAIEHKNGVTQSFLVKETAKGLELHIATERVEE